MTRIDQVLGYVRLFTGQYTDAELSRETGFPIGTVSCAVTRLQRDGHVRRGRDRKVYSVKA